MERLNGTGLDPEGGPGTQQRGVDSLEFRRDIRILCFVLFRTVSRSITEETALRFSGILLYPRPGNTTTGLDAADAIWPK